MRQKTMVTSLDSKVRDDLSEQNLEVDGVAFYWQKEECTISVAKCFEYLFSVLGIKGGSEIIELSTWFKKNVIFLNLK